MTNKIIQEIEIDLINQSKRYMPIPKFNTGDIISVKTISSLTKKKKQSFIGVCISIQNKGIRSTFTLRNIIDGQGIEYKFPIYSPLIVQIQVLKRKKTRASKLYYLRRNSKKHSNFFNSK